MKPGVQDVLTVMITITKMHFVFFISFLFFVAYANHKNIFYNKNFQIYETLPF